MTYYKIVQKKGAKGIKEILGTDCRPIRRQETTFILIQSTS